MATFDAIADLPLHIDDYALEGLARDVSSAFTRYSTVIRLRGAGEKGVGEDVSYAAEAHTSLQGARARGGGAGDLPGRGRVAAARRRLDDRVVLRPPRVARSLAGAARVRGVR